MQVRLSSVFANRRRVFLWGPLLLAAVAVACTGVSIWVFHRTFIEQYETQVIAEVAEQAKLIEAIGRENNWDAKKTLKQYTALCEAANYQVGEEGAFMVATLGEERVRLLYQRRSANVGTPQGTMDPVVAELMRKALAGKSGSVIGKDGRGAELLAAFAYVPRLNWAIVAQADPNEIEAPFLRSAVLLTSMMLVLTIGCGFLIVHLGKPLIRKMEAEIAERQRAEEMLATSAHEWAASFDAMTDGVSLHTPDHTIVNANQSFCKMLGKTREEIIGKKCYQAVHGADAPIAGCPLMASEESQCRKGAEFFEPTLNKWLSGSTSPVFDDAGSLVRFVHVVRDITERKQAEDELAVTVSLLKAQVETSLDGILLVDCQGFIIPLNDRFAKMWNIPQNILDEQDRTRMLEFAARQLKHPDMFFDTVSHLRAHDLEESHDQLELHDGRVFELYSSPLLGTNSVNLGRIWYFRDITEHKRLVASLTKAKAEAEAASRAKSEFLANVSHEIHSPMTAILGYADIMLEENVGRATRENAVIIKRNGEHLMKVIDDILDYAKIESETIEIEPMRCSPERLVVDAVAQLRSEANAKQLELKTHFEYPLPETICTDPLRLRQVLVNLLENAIKFTNEGEVNIDVRFISGDGVQRLQFDVTDTGVGMNESQIEELFQPFCQGDGSEKRKYAGTGLGLAISKRLVGLLGGDIKVHSAPGKGSTFSVTIDSGPLEGVAVIDDEVEHEILAV